MIRWETVFEERHSYVSTLQASIFMLLSERYPGSRFNAASVLRSVLKRLECAGKIVLIEEDQSIFKKVTPQSILATARDFIVEFHTRDNCRGVHLDQLLGFFQNSLGWKFLRKWTIQQALKILIENDVVYEADINTYKLI
eukprot:TRINITY_DN6561_c0_g1_i3.p1 TRINITY_DN6561_c0_g1~~TRINITY_DN6561_c0_g1_i3.p1  ORF type:complete len:140 (-),score=16.37 TRINITY_DN6561_c0_g1_i3:43-462(-)